MDQLVNVLLTINSGFMGPTVALRLLRVSVASITTTLPDLQIWDKLDLLFWKGLLYLWAVYDVCQTYIGHWSAATNDAANKA